jgi:hypothetical protein
MGNDDVQEEINNPLYSLAGIFGVVYYILSLYA